MAKRKLISIRKPRLRITRKGIKVTKPTARVGGKAGVNISCNGVSGSVRTKAGTLSTRRGFTPKRKKRKGCGILSLCLLASGLGVVSGIGYVMALLVQAS